MIVNPGIRRFLGSAIQRLFNSASVSLPLTHTAIPTRGDITPSFTRATTETGQKWDEAGYLDFTALAGEVVFKGARREYNQWTTSSVSLASGANKSLTLTAGTYQFSMGAGTGTATFSGTGGATGTLGASASGRVSVAKTITAGTFVVTASVADLADLQVCNITGETDQTTIRPYVSVGVESAPAYHGSMVDGVKCFPTDRSGNPISTTGSYPLVGYVPWEARTNAALHGNALSNAIWAVSGTPSPTQDAIGTDGTISAWTLTDNSAVATELILQNITLTAATWTASVFVDKTIGSQGSYPIFSVQTGASTTGMAQATIDTTNGVATPWTAYTGWTGVSCTADCENYSTDKWRVSITFTGTAAAWYLVLIPAGTTNATQSTGVYDAAAQGSAVFERVQLELGSFATPYIPTTTVAVARNADVEAVTTSGAILAVGGTISLTYIPYHSPVGTIALWGTYVDASNYTAILHDATNLIFRKRIAGVNYDATIANAFTSGTTYKMAASWGAGGSTIHLNGVAGTPHANTTAAQIAATMQFGADGNSLQQPGAAVIKNYIWQRQLSGSEQAAITA